MSDESRISNAVRASEFIDVERRPNTSNHSNTFGNGRKKKDEEKTTNTSHKFQREQD